MTGIFFHWMASTFGTAYLKELRRQEQRFYTILICLQAKATSQNLIPAAMKVLQSVLMT